MSLFSKTARPALEPIQSPIKWVSVFFPGINRPEREVSHSPPSNAEVKTEWSCTFILPIYLHGLDRNNFIFTVIKLLIILAHFFSSVLAVNIRTHQNFSTHLRSGNLCRSRWILTTKGGRVSVDGIATRYELDVRGIQCWWGEIFRIYVHTDWHRAQPAYSAISTGFFRRIKRPGR
jgi:hypothetical protein